MDAVHVGRDQYLPKDSIYGQRQANVAVVAHRGGVQKHLKDQDGEGWRAKEDDHGEFDEHREHDLHRMEAQSCRHVELKIGMMHSVQPPERRNGMEENVLPVDREIEKDDREGQGDGGRNLEKIENAPAVRLPDQRHTYGSSREEKPHEEGVHQHDAQVIRPAPTATYFLRTARGKKRPP
jgi:hypothetical protein